MLLCGPHAPGARMSPTASRGFFLLIPRPPRSTLFPSRRSSDLDRFHLVGTAAGGIVALDYALSFARRLRSLVVANSIGGVEDQDYQGLQGRLRPPQFAALPPQLRELGPSYRAANPQGEARWIELERLSNATRSPAQATRNPLSH